MPETKEIFDEVAGRYDRLNSLFSFGIHKLWRKRLAEEIGGGREILDVATGTAEVAIEIARKHPGASIVGIDPSANMLRIAESKIDSLGFADRIELVPGAAESLPFAEKRFDAAAIAFGIRNTVDYRLSLREIKRVVKDGGKLLVLEFAVPRNPLFRPLYMFYFRVVMPLVGSLYGRGREYRYLSESAAAFPQREKFVSDLEAAGFRNCSYREFTMGVVILYSAIR